MESGSKNRGIIRDPAPKLKLECRPCGVGVIGLRAHWKGPVMIAAAFTFVREKTVLDTGVAAGESNASMDKLLGSHGALLMEPLRLRMSPRG